MAKSLSRGRGLHRRRGILDPNRLSRVSSPWELPNWTLRLVIAVLLVGFPIALILAWAYDITAHGIQAAPKTPEAHRRRNRTLLVAAGVIVSAAAGFFLLPRVTAHKVDKSIAVLPFENRSEDKANATLPRAFRTRF